jgi:hypothetical protein
METSSPGSSPENEFSGRSSGTVVQSGRIEEVHVYPSDVARFLPPRQLPPLTSLFIERQADARWLDEQWARASAHHTNALFVISGPAGIGKTCLANSWLRQHTNDFPDGQLYADLAGRFPLHEAELDDILNGFLRALGVPSDRVIVPRAERVALLRTITHDRRVCVLLDNAFSAADVRVLAIAAPGCATVVTTRESMHSLLVDGAHLRRLAPWCSESGVEFLLRMLGEDPRVANEPDAIRRVVDLCGGVPLALGAAAVELARWPRWRIEHFVEVKARYPKRLRFLMAEADLFGVRAR